MKKIIMLFGLLATITGNAFAEPTIVGATATGITTKFIITLSEHLFSGYKVKIDLNNGKGFVVMTCSALTCSLSSNTLSKGVSASYSVGIYNSKDVLQGGKIDAPYVITSTAVVNTAPTIPPVNTAPISTTSYSKISNSGATLPDTAKLGTGSNDWACTEDNKTGLIWEVKTTDRGLRDWNNRYTWYEPDASKNGGVLGVQNGGICKGSQCDTYAFTNAVNGKGLCGKNDWRMPMIDELKGLLTKTNTVNQPLNVNLYIDANYFPNTNYGFWSSSPNAYSSGNAWLVYFNFGYSGSNYKGSNAVVRLVR